MDWLGATGVEYSQTVIFQNWRECYVFMEQMSNMPEDSVKRLPSPEEFFLRVPLYKVYRFDETSVQGVWELEYFVGTIDAYCPECKADSIFASDRKQKSESPQVSARDHRFSIELVCTRNEGHKLFYLFDVANMTLQKIGQFPSLADLSLAGVKRYSRVLSGEQFRELTRAIGLSAHGVGVGSFVYLRRIFESLIEEAHVLARNDAAWEDDRYQRSRMSERIELLESYLPAFLVHNRKLYGILSKGLHELTEDDCLQAFPVVKVGIEMILDAKLEDIHRTERLKEAEKAIQALSSTILKTSPKA